MNELQIFSNDEFGVIRTIEIDGEPWLVGKDVATALGYSNPQKAIRDHIDEEDRTVNESFTVNGTPPTIINESGVYALIFGSKLASAKKFKRWVTHEVLPTIRKTGGYGDKYQIAKLIASCKCAAAVKGIMSLYGFSEVKHMNISASADPLNESIASYLETVEEWQLTRIPKNDVYQDFLCYCKENNLPSSTINKFTKTLRELINLVVLRRKIGGDIVSFYVKGS